MCRQSNIFYWEGVPGWRAVGEGNPGELLCHMTRSLRFYGDGISFRIVFGQSSDPESFLVVHALLMRRILGVVGHLVSPFDLSRTLPVGGGLLVPCSLPGPPIIKQRMQMVTMVPGQGRWLQSVYFP